MRSNQETRFVSSANTAFFFSFLLRIACTVGSLALNALVSRPKFLFLPEELNVLPVCGDGKQVSVHGDDPSEVTPGQFRRFLVDSPLIRETVGGTVIRPPKPLSRFGPTSRSAMVVDDAMEVRLILTFSSPTDFSFCSTGICDFACLQRVWLNLPNKKFVC